MRRDRAFRREISSVIAVLHITDTSRLLEILKGDKKAIFTAASMASQIITYLDGLQPKLVERVAVGEPARPDADAERGRALKPEAR